MVKPNDIITLLNPRMGRMLDAAELAMEPDKFEVYRRMVLKEFGADGLGQDLDQLFNQAARQRRSDCNGLERK